MKPVTTAQYANVARGVGLCFLNQRSVLRAIVPPVIPKSKTIVVVEDNDDHWQLMRIALRACLNEYHVIRIDNKERMAEFLKLEMGNLTPPVEIILVDLYLPDREEGLDLIRQIRGEAKNKMFENTPVIVFSYSDEVEDIKDSYSNHASAYLVKPLDLCSWCFYFENVLDFWSNTIKSPQLRPAIR